MPCTSQRLLGSPWRTFQTSMGRTEHHRGQENLQCVVDSTFGHEFGHEFIINVLVENEVP